MRIGIDIDDVLVDTSKLMKEYIIKFDNNGDIADHMEEIMRGDIPNSIISRFIDNNIINIIDQVQIKPNAKEVLERLNKSNDIVFVTSRGEERFKGSEDITLNYLKRNNIKYDRIIFNAFDKAKICKDNNIDVLVDDSVKLCEEAKKEGIRSIVFTSIVNKDKNTKVKRVDNWLELEKII